MGGVGKAIKKVAKKVAKKAWEYNVEKPFEVLVKDPIESAAGLVGDALAPDINMPGEEPPAPTPDLDDATARTAEAQRKKRRTGAQSGQASTLLGGSGSSGSVARKTLLGE